MLILLRGLPGSGKSTLARKIVDAWPEEFVICSADSFFTDESGVYLFDARRLQEAHRACQDKARHALATGRSAIIDNTNTRAWEMLPYLDIADAAGALAMQYIAPEFDEVTCFRRNSHGVPLAAIEKMKARFEWDFWGVIGAYWTEDELLSIIYAEMNAT